MKTSNSWAFIFGMASIASAQAELFLNEWLAEHKANPPKLSVHNNLDRAVNLQKMVNSWKTNASNVYKVIKLFRITTIFLSVLALIVEA